MNTEPFYFLCGNSVKLTAYFSSEADAKAHFNEWIKQQDSPLDHCYTLVRHITSLRMIVEPQLRPMDGVPKLEALVSTS